MADEVFRARSLEREGRLDDALRMCLKAVGKNPQNLIARELAVELCRKLENVVELAHQLVELSNLLVKLSRPEKALDTLDQVLAISLHGRPQGEHDLLNLLKPEIHFQKGLIYRGEQRLQLAERCFRDSMTLSPDRWQTYLELGRTLMGMARFEEAVQVLQDGLRLSPADSGPILEALGEAFHIKGRNARVWYEAAIEHFRKRGEGQEVLRLSARLMELYGDDYFNELLNG